MDRLERTVFISYRRTNVPWAHAIFGNLTHHGFDVFMDFKGIASGDFKSIIFENIRARVHFVVLLTPSALERCSEPDDVFRREIETALDSRRNVVPIMLEGFSFGTPAIASHLIGKLSTLTELNALNVPVDYFDEAMARLRDAYLNVDLKAVIHPPSMLAREFAESDQAAASTAPSVERSELTAQQWFERGVSATDPARKLRLYNEAIRLKPDFAAAYASRGTVRRKIGELENAQQDYDEAIRLEPDQAIYFFNRANTRRDRNDLEGGLRDYDQAIRLDSTLAEAYMNRGVLRRQKGDPKGAIEDFSETIRLRPEYAEAYSNRCMLLLEKSDIGFIDDYKKYIALGGTREFFTSEEANNAFRQLVASVDSPTPVLIWSWIAQSIKRLLRL